MTIETFLDVEATWATFAAGEHENRVRGLRTWKLEDDLRRYAEIIRVTRPEVIIETGTKFGGSAVWFSQSGADIISVDIDGSFSEEARRTYPEIHWLISDSLAPATLDCVADLVAGRRCMVVLDSEHAAPHVADEIDAYGPFVTPGCYLVVEDGIFDLVAKEKAHLGGARIPAEGGPLLAIEHLLVDNPNWTRDVEIEQLTPRTYHAAGFWLRNEPEPEAAQLITEALAAIAEGVTPVPFEVLESRLNADGLTALPAQSGTHADLVEGHPTWQALEDAGHAVDPAVTPEPVAEPEAKPKRKPRKAAAPGPDPQP